jgi:ABC-2 type transport system permease protein
MDPSQALKKQNSAKAWIWLLLSVFVIAGPVGLAFAAGWAFDSDYAFFAVILVDIAIGTIAYRIATESAIARANRNREKMISALSQDSSVIE